MMWIQLRREAQEHVATIADLTAANAEVIFFPTILCFCYSDIVCIIVIVLVHQMVAERLGLIALRDAAEAQTQTQADEIERVNIS